MFPASTCALEEETIPPISAAKSSSNSKFCFAPTPLPPETNILASEMSTLFPPSLTTFRSLTFILDSSKVTGKSTISPFLSSDLGNFFITPGLTVAI